jgi:hypothetical protein
MAKERQGGFGILTSWWIPIFVALLYVFFLITARAPLEIAAFAAIGFGIVIVLWVMFRELAVHAAVSRAIAIGDPDDAIARARAAVERRFTTRGKAPFVIYEAIGVGMRGAWRDALAVLDRAAPRGAGARTWHLLRAATRIAAHTELGDAAAARAIYDRDVAPVIRHLRGPGVDVLARECDARVRFVEGDHAGALPIFRALADDIRLGPASRAAALLYASRCAAATGDALAAERDRAAAAKLAPKTWVATAA